MRGETQGKVKDEVLNGTQGKVLNVTLDKIK